MSGKHAVKSEITGEIIGKTKVKRRTYIVGIIALWLILAAILGTVAFLAVSRPRSKVVAAKVSIPSGFTSAQIARRLAEKGLISSAYTFRIYSAFNKVDGQFLPGSYFLRSDMSYAQIADKLTAGPKKTYIKVIIPEGFTLDQVNERLATELARPVKDFKAATIGANISGYDFTLMPAGATSLEGYIFPKTYMVEKKDSPKKIIGRMLHQFQVETGSLDWSPATSKSLSKNDIITIASLIEKEAKVPEERSLMAAVIYNRLAKGMPLQIDATVQYALPQRKPLLTDRDLKVQSPYNTYLHPGLPPGPIANPGIDSIKAALAPAPVDYLYYVLTSPDGHHTFAHNYSDFLQAKKRAGR